MKRFSIRHLFAITFIVSLALSLIVWLSRPPREIRNYLIGEKYHFKSFIFVSTQGTFELTGDEVQTLENHWIFQQFESEISICNAVRSGKTMTYQASLSFDYDMNSEVCVGIYDGHYYVSIQILDEASPYWGDVYTILIRLDDILSDSRCLEFEQWLKEEKGLE